MHLSLDRSARVRRILQLMLGERPVQLCLHIEHFLRRLVQVADHVGELLPLGAREGAGEVAVEEPIDHVLRGASLPGVVQHVSTTGETYAGNDGRKLSSPEEPVRGDHCGGLGRDPSAAPR